MVLKTKSFKFTKAKDDSFALSGFAFRYDELADLWYGKERMNPEIQIDVHPECMLLRDHDAGKPLGKIGKNLYFDNKKEGLYFKVDSLPNTQLASDTMELVNRGILTGLSVGFQAIKFHKEKEVTVWDKIELWELSVVAYPAYDSGRVDRAKINYLPKKPYKKVDDTKTKPPELIC